MSAPEKMFEVHAYEVHELIRWHREEQLKASDKERYDDAADHKRRGEELTRMVAPLQEWEDAQR